MGIVNFTGRQLYRDWRRDGLGHTVKNGVQKASRRGGGLPQINRCRRVTFQVIFKAKRFCIVFYESYPSTCGRAEIVPVLVELYLVVPHLNMR
jgi:hypothetical protein